MSAIGVAAHLTFSDMSAIYQGEGGFNYSLPQKVLTSFAEGNSFGKVIFNGNRISKIPKL